MTEYNIYGLKGDLYRAMIDEAIIRIEEADAELRRLEAIIEFETLEDLDRYKHDKLDAEAKKAIFTDLLHSAKEAKEFREYETLW